MSVSETIKDRRGVLTGSMWVNVFSEPIVDSEIVTMLPALTEVCVDLSYSTDNFYKIYTESSIEGYCQRKYVALALT